MNSWWAITVWRWGLKLGPLQVGMYARCDNRRVFYVSWFDRIWQIPEPLPFSVQMAEIERWKQYWDRRFKEKLKSLESAP